ncbi:MAG: MmgE/PrpD family protein [Beijerinckiaceae bacterium]
MDARNITVPEQELSEFVAAASYEAIPGEAIRVVKNILLAVFGTTIAGAAEDGCAALRDLALQQGGTPEATVLIYGDRLPAGQAALLNGVMARALDYCDAMAPGLHIGSSLLPATLAAVELRGGCDGREFVAALAAGAEIGSRMNLTESMYDGFDPTGIAGVFASTAAVCRVLRLSERETHQALALAFNRAGGSFQSNVDGSLAVRLIQGWVAESGVTCARLAKAGLTGPERFFSGVYGYRHLFGRDRLAADSVSGLLGERWALLGTMFKKYPSCGLTQGVTGLTLQALSEFPFAPEELAEFKIILPPYGYRLVGHEFRLGDNPRVDAQFSAQYCVANAIVRRSSALSHFRPDAIAEPRILDLIPRIRCLADEALDARGHTAVDIHIELTDGRRRSLSLDHPLGFPERPLAQADHQQRFADCLSYADGRIGADRAESLLRMIDQIETQADVRQLIPLTMST